MPVRVALLYGEAVRGAVAGVDEAVVLANLVEIRMMIMMIMIIMIMIVRKYFLSDATPAFLCHKEPAQDT